MELFPILIELFAGNFINQTGGEIVIFKSVPIITNTHHSTLILLLARGCIYWVFDAQILTVAHVVGWSASGS